MCEALGKVQFKIRKPAGFETAAEAIDGRFAHPGLKGRAAMLE